VWSYCAQIDKEREFLGLVLKPRLTVSPDLASKPVATILVVWPQNTRSGFPVLASKSAARFLGFGLKTKWAMVCWLRHKTNRRMKTVLGTVRIDGPTWEG
jgi:hypothetical protein